MEGVGSRLGRASSRYGPSASTAVFNGPVRKWKRKWVHVSSSPASTNNSHKNTLSHTTNSRLLLCKWTPLSSTTSPAAEDEVEDDDDEVGPPRRRFRYTPVVVIEEERKAAKKVETGVNALVTEHSSSWQASAQDEMDKDEPLKEETQDQGTTHLDLGLSLKDNNNSDPDADGQLKKASSGGFWAVG